MDGEPESGGGEGIGGGTHPCLLGDADSEFHVGFWLEGGWVPLTHTLFKGLLYV